MLTTNEGKTALDVARERADKDIIALLESRMTKPACERGAACFVCTESHRAERSHPQGWLEQMQTNTETAKREYGEGNWEVNVCGDIKSAVGWKTLDGNFKGDAAKLSGTPNCSMWFDNLEAVKVGHRQFVTTMRSDNQIGPYMKCKVG